MLTREQLASSIRARIDWSTAKEEPSWAELIMEEQCKELTDTTPMGYELSLQELAEIAQKRYLSVFRRVWQLENADDAGRSKEWGLEYSSAYAALKEVRLYAASIRAIAEQYVVFSVPTHVETVSEAPAKLSEPKQLSKEAIEYYKSGEFMEW